MGLFGKERLLYFPGCLTQTRFPNIVSNYKSVLSDLGIEYITTNELKCCGSPCKSAGLQTEYDLLKEFNRKVIERLGITKIISNDPRCVQTFKEQGINSEHITQTIARLLHKIPELNSGEVNYNDSCSMVSLKLFKEPRAILKASGFILQEMKTSFRDATCCGAGGLLKANSPVVSKKIALKRLGEATHTKIICADPLCYLHLKENAKKQHILELSEVLVEV